MIPMAAPPSGLHLDKVLHAFAYAILTVGLIFAWPKRALPLIFVVAFGIGGIIEICQGLFASGRTASFADALANGFGGLTVILTWMILYPLYQKYLDVRELPQE